MKKSEQAALIRSLEAQFEDRPGGLERRVVVLAIIGYAFFAGILITLVCAGAAAYYLIVRRRLSALGVKLLVPISVAIWACAKALFVPFGRPGGMPLARRDAPRLFDLLDRLRGILRTPRIHEVLLTLDVNASMTQVPRLGWFGWYRNSVTIGWPLIQGLSAPEFEAVMAHELGHLSRAHGRLGAWAYRVRVTFARLAEQFESQKSVLNAPVQSFLEWWWPKLEAHSFVLSRRQELDADREAAKLAGDQNLLTALLRLAAIGESLPRFWSPLFARAGSGSPIPGDAIAQLGGFVRQLDGSAVAPRLRVVVSESTGFEDTHPAFSDRAKALGIPLSGEPLLPPLAEAASVHYFGSSAASVCAQLQARWEAAAEEHWETFGSFLRSRQAKLEALSAKPVSGLTADEAWERCELLQALDRDSEAFAAAVSLLDREPGRVEALLFVGAERLKQGDERGVDDLARAAELSSDARAAALTQLVAHHRRAKREAQALELESRLLAHEDQLREAAQERVYAEADELAPHRLSSDEIAAIVKALRAAVPELVEIRIARKKLNLFPDSQPVHVIGFRVRAPWYRRSSTAARNALGVLTGTPLPCRAYLIGLDASPVATSRFAELEAAIVFGE